MEFVFVSGRPSLDFAGTLKWRRQSPEEQLVSPAALAVWVERAGLVSTPPTIDDSGLTRALELREVIYRLVFARTTGQTWDRTDIRRLRHAADLPPTTARLNDDGTLRRSGDLTAVLATLARDASELLGGPDVARVRECGRPECTRLYVDASRTQNRRWCGMAECGNRIKAASYRRRNTTRPPA